MQADRRTMARLQAVVYCCIVAKYPEGIENSALRERDIVTAHQDQAMVFHTVSC